MNDLKKIIVCIVIVFLTIKIKADNPTSGTNIYILPTIKIGWTFHAGFNWGFKVSAGILRISKTPVETTAAVSFSMYWVNVEGSTHLLKALNLGIQSEYFDIGVGAGDIIKFWGKRNINVDRAYGYTFDVSCFSGHSQSPWLGISMFAPTPGAWAWFKKPIYWSAYTYLRQTPIKPY